MSFDPETLRNWQVPVIHQQLARRDTALYALSTGYGADPLDETELRFVDPAHTDMCASPSMALVLGYPGFWIADPALGVDAARVLHLDQSIELLDRLPVEGEIRGVTHTSELIDRGAGRGALVRNIRDIETGGKIVARLQQTLLLRSDGGFAASPGPRTERRRVPDTAPDGGTVLDLPANAALLYRLNGDLNPLHSDPQVARRGGFERPIMHGMGTFGFVCRLLVRSLCDGDPARLASIGMRFTAPAYPGETLKLHWWRSGAFQLIRSDGTRIADDGHFVLR